MTITETVRESGYRIPPLHVLKRRQRDDFIPDGRWPVYNSPITEYQRYFSRVLGGRKIIDIMAGHPEPVVVDLMAPSGTLADIFSSLPEGASSFGVAVSLEDIRSPQERQRDADLHIQQLPGDLTNSRTWKQLAETLGERKAHLIMARPSGGIGHLPNHGGFYAVTLQRMWNMLDKNGMLLLQVPNQINFRAKAVSVENWVASLQNQGIKAKRDDTCRQLCIERSPESPEILPFPKGLILYDPGDRKHRTAYDNKKVDPTLPLITDLLHSKDPSIKENLNKLNFLKLELNNPNRRKISESEAY